MATGTLSIDRAAGGDPGVVIARLYGPRGGVIGDTQISLSNAREAYSRLRVFASPPASALDTLLDAAEAVLRDNFLGLNNRRSLNNLTLALHAMDPDKGNYRTEAE